MNTEPARDTLYRLLAQGGRIEAITGQYQAILADLNGEGYVFLAKGGTGVPYFDGAMAVAMTTMRMR